MDITKSMIRNEPVRIMGKCMTSDQNQALRGVGKQLCAAHRMFECLRCSGGRRAVARSKR